MPATTVGPVAIKNEAQPATLLLDIFKEKKYVEKTTRGIKTTGKNFTVFSVFIRVKNWKKFNIKKKKGLSLSIKTFEL